VTLLFMFIFGLYITYSLVMNLLRDKDDARPAGRRAALVLQTPLFLLAAYLGYHVGVFGRGLVNPLWIVLGFLIGHFLFALASLRMHATWSGVFYYLFDVRPFGRFLVESPDFILRFLAVSIAEELIYRVVAQDILLAWTGNAVSAIALTAILFSVAHWHFFRNEWLRSFEFLLFSLLLGGLYHYSGSFILAVVVHTLRNLEIVYHEWLIKVEEGQTEQEAFAALDAVYAKQALEQP